MWFGATIVVFLALVSVTLFAGFWSGAFWSQFLPLAGFIIVVSFLRGPLDRLGRAFRFIAWFFIGVAGATLVALSKMEPFNLWVAAVLGLALAVGDLVAEHVRSKREAEHV